MPIYMGKLENWTLDKRKPVSPQLREILRSRIIRNDLKPVSKVSEPELAKLYGVSRQPVREAFITLVNEGLLEILPQRGTIVKAINPDAVLDGRFIREAVEADLVKELAANPDPRLISALRDQLKEQRKAVKEDPHKFHALDERFHRTLANGAGRRTAWDFLDLVKAHLDRVRFIADEMFSVSKLVDHHTKIVDSIEDQKPEAAEAAMREHLRGVLDSLPEVQKLYPEYFEDSTEFSLES